MAQLKNLLVLGSARFSNLIKGIVERAQNGCFYCTCDTAAGTAAKVVTTADPGFALREGVMIGVKYTNSNSASNVTLNVNDTGAKSIWFNNTVFTGSEARIAGYAGRFTYYMYDGTYWTFVNYGGNYTDDNTYTSAYCGTSADTAAKTASCTNYALKVNSYLHVTIRYENTAAAALTLNVNSKGAKPIYINGSASSASNYTLPAGTYICFYNGTNYYFRNDAVLPGEIEKATNVTGTVAPENGGTGKTSLTAAASALINALNTGPNDPVDDDYFISQYVGGGTSNTAYYRRPLSALWNYIKSKITKTVITDALEYTPPVSPFYREAAVKATKTYTDVIATDTTAALSNFYAVKITPDSYSGSWSVLIRIRATIAGVNEANGLGFQESYFRVEGMRNAYATYYVWNNIRNTSYRAYYYHEAYWAKSAGLTNGYTHLLGVGLRSSWNPTTAANSRTFTFDILDYSDCTVDFLDNMLIYADVPGTGSTNYQGNTEFNGSTQGFTRSGTDSNQIERLQVYTFKPTAGAVAIYPYTICLKDSVGTYQSIVTSNSTGTSKSRNTNGFVLEGIYYWNSSATLAVNTKTTSSSLFYTAIPFNLQYSTNCGTSLVVDAPVYLVGAMNDGLFYLDSTWWTQELPDTEDGKLYIFLGFSYSTTNVMLLPTHPIYWYKGGAIREYVSSLDYIVSSFQTGCSTIASAITDAGVTTAATDSPATMATNIGTVATNNYTSGVTNTQKGNAAATDVIAGKTFTSLTAGVNQTGSLADYRGTTNAKTVNTDTSTGSGTYTASLDAGAHDYVKINQSNAYNAGVTATKKGNAASADVVLGKTFTSLTAGVNASGGLADYRSNYQTVLTDTATGSGIYTSSINSGVHAYVKINQANAYNAGVTATKKGDATTGDVIAGKKFTSLTAGVEKTGTLTDYRGTTNAVTVNTDTNTGSGTYTASISLGAHNYIKINQSNAYNAGVTAGNSTGSSTLNLLQAADYAGGTYTYTTTSKYKTIEIIVFWSESYTPAINNPNGNPAVNASSGTPVLVTNATSTVSGCNGTLTVHRLNSVASGVTITLKCEKRYLYTIIGLGQGLS